MNYSARRRFWPCGGRFFAALRKFYRLFFKLMRKSRKKSKKVFHILKTPHSVVENSAAGGIPNWRLSKPFALFYGLKYIFYSFTDGKNKKVNKCFHKNPYKALTFYDSYIGSSSFHVENPVENVDNCV
jgi:hypothetical protein